MAVSDWSNNVKFTDKLFNSLFVWFRVQHLQRFVFYDNINYLYLWEGKSKNSAHVQTFEGIPYRGPELTCVGGHAHFGTKMKICLNMTKIVF